MALPSFVRVVDGVPTINIGQMRHQLTLYAQAPASPPTYDAAGVQMNWTSIQSGIYAAIGGQAAGSSRQGMDRPEGDQLTSQQFVTIAVWYQAIFAPNQRVVNENGTTFIIQSIENVLEMNVVLVLTCLGVGAND